ncbi:ABC transporter permease [Arthrobacter sunyaminii]|uniref:ABC transporter permease n=1 Tax=Arthrobacter sunyaminii TaxID=2816859 RepID=UPI003080F00D
MLRCTEQYASTTTKELSNAVHLSSGAKPPAPGSKPQSLPPGLHVRWPDFLRRVGYALLVIVLVTLGVRALMSLAPGSIAEVVLGESATAENVAALEQELGLDRPFFVQYFDWATNAVQGDLGTSLITHMSVSESILQRLPVTLELAVLALVIAMGVAVPLAVLSAAFPNSILDRVINAVTSVFLSIPAFVAGPILVFVFAVQLGMLPALGWIPIGTDLGGNLRSALLPAVAVALTEIAAFHRVLRADLIGTLREDYVAAARAKGMRPGYVMFRHAFRPSSFSLLTISGLSLARLIGGTIIVEALFVLPGLGQLISGAIIQRDVITVQGVVTIIAVAFVVINMLVDVGYGIIDPRVRNSARRAKKKAIAPVKAVPA